MLIDQVHNTIQKYQLIRPREQILVAVSGGPDSVALLSLLVALRDKLKIKLVIGMVDHRLRPAAFKKERALVEKLSRLWSVPFHLASRSVPKRGGVSLETAARDVRYDALSGLAKKSGCRVIAMGHTADDQAETVLMRLLRGAGTRGLAGIPPVRFMKWEGKRFRIVRPLLECHRAELEIYLKKHRIPAAQDRMNRSNRFLRNRIRHQLIPDLEKAFSPKLRSHLGKLALILREDLDYLQKITKPELKKLHRMGRGKANLDRLKLRQTAPTVRFLLYNQVVESLLGSTNGFAQSHWLALDQLVLHGTGKAIDLPHGARAEVISEEKLCLSRRN